MALQFDPSPYLQVWAARQRQEEQNRPDPNALGQNILQGLQMLTENRRQKELMDIQRREIDYKYGKNQEGIMTPTNAPASSRLFPGRNLNPAMPMVDKLSEFMAGGMKNQQDATDVMPYLGETERKLYFENSFPENKKVSYQKAEYVDERGRARIGKWNPSTGVIEKTPQDEYAPQTARGETAGNLRKEFIDRPEVKEYQNIATSVRSMDSLLKNALSGNMNNQLALDQALITMYNKLTDPNSVVRESEYARTPENLPVINRISGAIEKIKQGGAGITDEDRKALVLGAKIIANERGKTYSQTRSGYVNLAGRMSLDPSLITATMPEFNSYEISESGNPQSAPQVGGMFNGEKIKSVRRIR